MKENGKKLLHSRRGNSIVSVMMAFVVLLIVLAMFTGVVLFANRMNGVSKRRTDAANEFIKTYYTEHADAPSSGGLTLSGPGGPIALDGVGVGQFSRGEFSMYYFAQTH